MTFTYVRKSYRALLGSIVRWQIFCGLELVSMELIKPDRCNGLPYKGAILCRTLSLDVIQSNGIGAWLLA